MDLFDLKGKTAFVTSAGTALGRVYATALARAGACVYAADEDMALARQAADGIASLGYEGSAVCAAATDEEQMNDMVADIVRERGGLDIAVNFMDVRMGSPMIEMPLEEWRAVLNANITGMYIAGKAAGMAMVHQGKGSIINTSSIGGYVVSETRPLASYNSAKAGVLHLTRSWAAEWAASGVRVNSLSHGYLTGYGAGEGEISRTPMKRSGRPEEMCGALIYLASDASSYATGIDILIDGGFHCWQNCKLERGGMGLDD